MHRNQCEKTVIPQGVVLPENAPNRIPVAAAADLGENYFDDYDQKTLFYDCFFTACDGNIELLGPPSLNLVPMVRAFYLDGNAVKVTKIVRHKLERLRVLCPTPRTEEPTLAIDLGRFGMKRVRICSREAAFNGRRVLLTMFRYEPISWVVDWVCYHVDAHGVDAVLIYANFVDRAALEVLSDKLNNISGLLKYSVVIWDYPYGPVKDSAFARNIPRESPRRWSSCFSQTGILEHARLRFLGKARAVLNLDVDELAVTEDGSSIFSLLDKFLSPVVILREKRVGGQPEELSTPLMDRRHRYFSRLLPSKKVPATKWLLAPGQLDNEAQWLTHKVHSAQAAEANTGAWYAHFAPLNMGWNCADRSRICVVQDTSSSVPLSKAFARVHWST